MNGESLSPYKQFRYHWDVSGTGDTLNSSTGFTGLQYTGGKVPMANGRDAG